MLYDYAVVVGAVETVVFTFLHNAEKIWVKDRGDLSGPPRYSEKALDPQMKETNERNKRFMGRMPSSGQNV